MFLTAQSGDLFAGGKFSRDGTQKFSRLTSRLPHGQNFQSRKTLRKFFKIFVLSVLITCSRLNPVAKIVCFALFDQFLKHLVFPSIIFNCSLSCLFNSLSNSPCHSKKHSFFFIISTSISKKKVRVFLFSLNISCSSPWIS